MKKVINQWEITKSLISTRSQIQSMRPLLHTIRITDHIKLVIQENKTSSYSSVSYRSATPLWIFRAVKTNNYSCSLQLGHLLVWHVITCTVQVDKLASVVVSFSLSLISIRGIIWPEYKTINVSYHLLI